MVAKQVELEIHMEARSSGEYFQLMSEKTATMSIGGAWRHKGSLSIGQPVSDVGITGGGETKSTSLVAVENILPPTKAPSLEKSSNEEKGNTGLRLHARQSMARKETRGMCRSPSAVHSNEGGISEEAKATLSNFKCHEPAHSFAPTSGKVVFPRT